MGAVLNLIVVARKTPNQGPIGVVEPLNDVYEFTANFVEKTHFISRWDISKVGKLERMSMWGAKVVFFPNSTRVFNFLSPGGVVKGGPIGHTTSRGKLLEFSCRF